MWPWRLSKNKVSGVLTNNKISLIPLVTLSYVAGKRIAGKTVDKLYSITTGTENPEGGDSW